jgi:ribosomal protein S18 acetylase RimI-like enzyme
VIDIRPLTGISFATLSEAFNDAFGDYVVPMQMTAEALEMMQRRRGYVPEASLGAFEGDRIVGFVLTCLDGDRAYNSGTGVAVSHRRHGIARELMQRVSDLIAQHGAKSYLLEVIESNDRAAALYRAVGFDERRRFQCWTVEQRRPSRRVVEIANPDLDSIASYGDVEPAWQNSVAAIERAIEPYVVLGDEDGAVVFFPKSGDLPLLTVRKDARRKGIGTQLLAAATTRAAKPLRVLNVDDRDRGIAAFMSAAGAKPLVRQIEMIRTL